MTTARVIYLRHHPVLTRPVERPEPEPAPEFWWIHSPPVQLGMGAIIISAFAFLVVWEFAGAVVDVMRKVR